ncbi:MAG: shikimate dehydrogenase [Bacteroidales bacterium]|nr:shikimate dehydrogenase [Bacteroidales bacterium]MBN2820143.1 shikimate dehydrogenase [Bacteroidales bacterium]
MKKYGLVGYPLGHSFSKTYFTNKFKKEGIVDCEYNNYALESLESLTDLIKEEKDLIGLNVTIPHKQGVLKYLDELDNTAIEVGAVNTIKISRDSNNNIFLKGFNTDVYGFMLPLKDAIKQYHTQALILGTGGAAKAVCWVLKQLGVEYNFVSRKPKNQVDFSYEDLNDELISQYKLIINTSPIGMFPNVDQKPAIPYNAVTGKHILYDLVYNPEVTQFLAEGAKKMATTINGLPMLYNQAEKAWEIWNN